MGASRSRGVTRSSGQREPRSSRPHGQWHAPYGGRRPICGVSALRLPHRIRALDAALERPGRLVQVPREQRRSGWVLPLWSRARRLKPSGLHQPVAAGSGRRYRGFMSLYPILPEMKKLLNAVDGWLDKAQAHAKAKNYDVNILLQCRLAPDMFPLVRQVQATCDSAKFAAARAAGKTPPAHPDTEQTIEELRARIAQVSRYLDEFTAK